MPIQRGNDKPNQTRRPDKYTPNTKQNSQVPAVLKSLGIPVTPENKEKVHRAIGNDVLDYNNLRKLVKAIFGK